MNPAQLIHQDSGNQEWMTPQFVIECARGVLGVIDLDPASSALANERVIACRYFDKETDGLNQEWFGRVFLNHPFGRHSNPDWISKFVGEYDSGRVDEAINICFAATSEGWFAPLMRYPQCYLRPRTQYVLPNGETARGVTKGSVVTYLGPNVDRFFEVFRARGACVRPA